jgi:hypothetical protein
VDGIVSKVDSYVRLAGAYLIGYGAYWSTSRDYIHPKDIQAQKAEIVFATENPLGRLSAPARQEQLFRQHPLLGSGCYAAVHRGQAENSPSLHSDAVAISRTR